MVKTGLYRVNVKQGAMASTSTGERLRSAARERILETAERLFYRDGYRAVGVDTIVAESGVAKMTLYRHFPSKDDLIAAYLERTNEQLLAWMEGLIAPHRDPRAALEAVFDGVAKLASSPECLGCAFVAAAGEFPEPDHPGHQAAAAHKRAVVDRLRELARTSGSAGCERARRGAAADHGRRLERRARVRSGEPRAAGVGGGEGPHRRPRRRRTAST